MSRLFGRTLREPPARATTPSHRLLLRAGMIHQLGTGIYSYLPLAWRALAKIEAIIAQEMDRIDGQRIGMPVVHPADLWRKSGRWDTIGAEMVRFRDREDHDMVLAMTHEEVVADLVAHHVNSYRELPVMLYQIQTKFRDEPRSRGGLIRVREFVMKDAYSLHPSQADLDGYYERVVHAYVRTFRRCGLEPLVVEGSVGMMGGSIAHEFMLVTEHGEDTLLICSSCGYAANRDVAVSPLAPPPAELPGVVTEVATPGKTTIEGVAAFVGVPVSKTLKAVFYDVGGEVVFVAIRGDLEVNEPKLVSVLQAPTIQPASDQELATAGIVAGYASPAGLKDIKVIVDRSVPAAPNLVGGANKEGFHLLNLNFGRDFGATVVADVATVRGGDPCPACGNPLRETRGIEMGNTFKLGTRFCEKIGATFLDQEGIQKPAIMASYGIGVGRLLASVIEHHHDDNGIIFPMSVSPFDVQIVQLGDSADVRLAAERLEAQLTAAGLEVLRDDRGESAGVKFKDADLIGLPIRVTVSPRSLAKNSLEVKLRRDAKADLVELDRAAAEISDLCRGLLAGLDPESPLWDPTTDPPQSPPPDRLP